MTQSDETGLTEPSEADDSLITLVVDPFEPVSSTLIDFDGGVFTMRVPPNWTFETTGEYETFGFHLYDPERPARQIFFYGSISDPGSIERP